MPLSHANVLASIRGAMLAWRWSADDVLVHALPLSHQHGLSGVNATLLAGSRAVVARRFEPAALRDAIAAGGATVLFAVPAMYERLDAWDGIDEADFSSLRLAVSGSAPLSPALAERIAARLGQVPLERYGSTEAGLDVSNLYDGPRRPGRVGLAAARDRAAPRPARSGGEILLRGPQVFDGYWRAARRDRRGVERRRLVPHAATSGAIDAADGSLAITGRSKELIITGGLNVYPREVEVVLEEHAGRRARRRGRRAVRALGRGGRRLRRRRRRARRRGADRALPRAAVGLQVPEAGGACSTSFRSTEMGKVRRDALATMAGDGGD